jgi:hypothetical protein
MSDRITYKTMTKYVKVFKNGVHIGDIRYFPALVGWGYVSPEFTVGLTEPTIDRVKRRIEGRK